jgi:hypothetical protein
MAVENRTTLKTYFETNDVPTQAQFQNLIDSAANLAEANNFQGSQVSRTLNEVITSVTGTLTVAGHSGAVLKTSGNVTIPTTAGFNCLLIAGGTHTVTFNSTTSAAMAAGDLMSIVVESSTVIHAVLSPSAGKVAFS